MKYRKVKLPQSKKAQGEIPQNELSEIPQNELSKIPQNEIPTAKYKNRKEKYRKVKYCKLKYRKVKLPPSIKTEK